MKKVDTCIYREAVILYEKRWLNILFPSHNTTVDHDTFENDTLYLGFEGTLPTYSDYKATVAKGIKKITEMRVAIDEQFKSVSDLLAFELKDISILQVLKVEGTDIGSDKVLSKQKEIGRLIHSGICSKKGAGLWINLLHAQIYLDGIADDNDFTSSAKQKKEPIKQLNKKPSTKTTNKQEDILSAIALLYIGSEKNSRPEPKELAKEIISDLNAKHSNLGIKEELVTLETLEKYITNGIERITE